MHRNGVKSRFKELFSLGMREQGAKNEEKGIKTVLNANLGAFLGSVLCASANPFSKAFQPR